MNVCAAADGVEVIRKTSTELHGFTAGVPHTMAYR